MSRSKLAETLKATEDMLARLRELAAAHQRFEKEPESGSVIRFTKRYTLSGRGYSFAALRIGPRWYITGSRNSSSARTGNWMTFEELVEFIGDGKAWVSGDWIEVPTLNPEIPVDGSEELLKQAEEYLTGSGGKNTGDVAKGLLEMFRSWAADTSEPQVESPTGARFHRRVYPDM